MEQIESSDFLLTPKELRTYLRDAVELITLAHWRTNGKGPAFIKVGRKVRYRMRDVLDWVEAGKSTIEKTG